MPAPTQTVAEQAAQPAGMRIAVGIATKGRAAVLREVVGAVQRQTQAPSRIVICHTDPSDVAGLVADGLDLLCVSAGLCNQRNAILEHLADDRADAVMFFDDDFLPMPDYLAATAAALLAHPDIVVTTGHVLADGINGPGLTVAQGRAILANQPAGPLSTAIGKAQNGYGCNMAVRLSLVRQRGLRFDTQLPLYGWLEDVDFTRRLRPYGRIVRLAAARGVHLGVKAGRGSGKRLGYSQVSNPVYLARRGTISWVRAILSCTRNLVANTVRSLRPEPYVDRLGRLQGNVIALVDLARGRVTPTRVLQL